LCPDVLKREWDDTLARRGEKGFGPHNSLTKGGRGLSLLHVKWRGEFQAEGGEGVLMASRGRHLCLFWEGKGKPCRGRKRGGLPCEGEGKGNLFTYKEGEDKGKTDVLTLLKKEMERPRY